MEHYRHTDRNIGKSPDEISDIDVANLARLHVKSGLPANFEVISAQIRRERGEVRDGLAQAVLKEVQSEKKLTPEQINDAIELIKESYFLVISLNIRHFLPWDNVEKALRETPTALKKILKAKQAGLETAIYYEDDEGFDIGIRSKGTPEVTMEEYEKEFPMPKGPPGLYSRRSAYGLTMRQSALRHRNWPESLRVNFVD